MRSQKRKTIDKQSLSEFPTVCTIKEAFCVTVFCVLCYGATDYGKIASVISAESSHLFPKG